jgi:hypothetical protein
VGHCGQPVKVCGAVVNQRRSQSAPLRKSLRQRCRLAALREVAGLDFPKATVSEVFERGHRPDWSTRLHVSRVCQTLRGVSDWSVSRRLRAGARAMKRALHERDVERILRDVHPTLIGARPVTNRSSVTSLQGRQLADPMSGVHATRGARSPRPCERQSNGHVFEHADRRPARADGTFRCRAWQSVASANGDRAPASWPRER